MLKRNFAVVVLAGLVLGGAAVAWAGDGPSRPTVLAAARTGDTTPPTTAPPEAATPEVPSAPADPRAKREAKREAVRACMEKAGEDAAARQACLAAAGVRKPGAAGGAKRPGGPLAAVGALGKAVHGTLLVPGDGGTWQTITFDRGTVGDATDGSKIVLDRPDGQKVTLALTPDTRYRGIADAAAIQKGKPALAVSKDGKATLVGQKDPARPERPGGGNNEGAPVVPND